MVRLLRQQGVPAIAQDTHLQTTPELWLIKYENFLKNVADLRQSSRIVYCRNARYLLSALFPDDHVDWAIVNARDALQLCLPASSEP